MLQSREREDFDLSKYNQNFYQYALDLIYDLYVVENKMDYGASEKIAEEFLEVRGGKFGLTEISMSRDSAQQRLLDEMVAY